MSIRSRNKPSAEFNAASISDIVFLLLIYFMLTSSFVTQSSLRIQLPSSSSDRPSKGGNYITLAEDGAMAWNNTKVADREELRPFLEKILVEDDDKSNDIINLRIDKRVVMEDVAPVIGLVAEYEGAKLVIMTEQE
ncbi:MAG: biopolymer transporter ExbD [Bacteroidota bacterium]